MNAISTCPVLTGELQRQRWWVEVKGRKGTLEPEAVRNAVTNAIGRTDVDVLVIVTNTGFSNPTCDWVTTSQTTHRLPKVRLWDRSHLERLAGQHPEVVIRLFADALSPNGKLEVARSRFWNHSSYSDRPNLKMFWQNRDDLEWSDQSSLAVVVSELANGSISRRPWALLWTVDALLNLLGHALLNLLPFVLRADRAGIEERPYIKAVAYLTLTALHRSSATVVGNVFRQVWDYVDKPCPKNIRDMAIAPVLNQLTREVQDVCVTGCSRISTDQIELTDAELDSYWDRLRLPTADDDDQEEPRKHLVIEKASAPCEAGFALDGEHGCPIVALRDPEKDIEAALKTIEQIVRARGRVPAPAAR